MMRDYFKTRPDLVISIVFHLLVFFGLLVFFLVKSCSKEKPVYVFEMVDTSEATTPSVPSQAESKTKSQPSTPQKKEMMPIKRLDYEEFLKENAKPKPKPKPKLNPSAKAKQNEIKPLPKFQVQPDQPISTNPSQPIDVSVLQEYGQYVYKKISAQWNKPGVNAGKNLSVKVRFVVLSTGRIESVKIVQSSGNIAFDNSILTVFKTIAQFKPSPSGKKETFTMNFKLAD
jgi:colicin import membrane protein